MATSLLIFDSHPVQYRVPVWQEMESMQPGYIHIVYASDCSKKGHIDKGFDRTVIWDEPMLEGYSHTILNCEKGEALSNWNSLTGAGVKQIIKQKKPKAILLTGLNYKYDLVAYWQAVKRGIPVWLRCENQDEANNRGRFKNFVRFCTYIILYKGVSNIFYIGELNKKHYIKHGVPLAKLLPAKYCTADRFEAMNTEQKQRLRTEARKNAGISEQNLVIGFSGKLITKKNPELLFSMLDFLPKDLREKIFIYFIGSGELENSLIELANDVFTRFGVKTFFAGFVNQSKLASHYLAMDILILPSRRMGETWGLVVNEAMQAGCAIIVSDAVGCSADFRLLERFQVFPENKPEELAKCVCNLSNYSRDYKWASEILKDYSIKAAAKNIMKTIEN